MDVIFLSKNINVFHRFLCHFRKFLGFRTRLQLTDFDGGKFKKENVMTKCRCCNAHSEWSELT